MLKGSCDPFGSCGSKSLRKHQPLPWLEKYNRANPSAQQEINSPVFPKKSNNILLDERGWTFLSLKMFL